MTPRKTGQLLLAAALSGIGITAAQAATSVSVEAYDNATIQPAGPRSGNNGLNFFNIEGADNGSFASYGVARFNLAAAKASFDAAYGVGGWVIDGIALQLTQSNASFTANGDVLVRYTDVDTPSPLNSSGFRYANLGTDFADATTVLSYTFTEVATGTVDSLVLWDGSVSVGAQLMLADIASDDVLTLVLAEASAGVAATYAGYNHNTYAGPTLQLSVSAVPEPASAALLLAGAALLGGMALRRR